MTLIKSDWSSTLRITQNSNSILVLVIAILQDILINMAITWLSVISTLNTVETIYIKLPPWYWA